MAGWPLAALPAFWLVRAWQDPAPGLLAGGLACTAGWLLFLGRRVHARLT